MLVHTFTRYLKFLLAGHLPQAVSLRSRVRSALLRLDHATWSKPAYVVHLSCVNSREQQNNINELRLLLHVVLVHIMEVCTPRIFIKVDTALHVYALFNRVTVYCCIVTKVYSLEAL